MKIIFMGTPNCSVETLNMLIENHNVLAVITQPDTKKGRGKKLQFSPVKEAALNHNIEVLQPAKIRDKDFVETLKKYNADIFIVVAYGQILSKEVLEIPKFGCINVHFSLLPKYRGAAPIQWAIINGEKTTGVTIMYMDVGLDTGDMILKMEIPILPEDTSESLHDSLATIGANALANALTQIENNTIVREKQDDSLSSYAKIIKKDMGLIDFNKSTEDIINLIRGLNPWPSAFTFHNDSMLKIWSAKPYDVFSNKEIPGFVINILPKDGFVVKTKDSALLITEVQGASGKRMNASDYLRGNPITIGDSLGGRIEN